MPTRKQTRKRLRIDLVRDSQPQLLSAFDDIANEKRARITSMKRVIGHAKAELGTRSKVSDECAIANILADLRHYCDARDLSFHEVQKAAYAMYQEDAEDFRTVNL